jgi:phosphatidylethanolamine/phosphatidyl-N-methylethanolamine N-methyltransferase
MREGLILEPEKIKKIYACYSKIYDLVFKRFFFPRQRHVIQSLGIKPGEWVLDVGIGTGLSLSLYPDYCNVVGIDLSESMLKIAAKKVKRNGFGHVWLSEMDALNLAFKDDAFDYVIATFVISVVPNPVKAIEEMKRVSKKKGKIIIINHFQSKRRIIAKMEELISPLCTKVGWRSDLALDYLIKKGNLEIDNHYKLKRLDLWSVIMANNNK